MQVPVRAVDEARDIALRADVGRQLVFGHELERMRVAEAPLALDFAVKVLDVAPVQREVEIPELEIAVDAIALDALEHDVSTLESHAPRDLGGFVAQPALDLVDLDETVEELTAVASGSA